MRDITGKATASLTLTLDQFSIPLLINPFATRNIYKINSADLCRWWKPILYMVLSKPYSPGDITVVPLKKLLHSLFIKVSHRGESNPVEITLKAKDTPAWWRMQTVFSAATELLNVLTARRQWGRQKIYCCHSTCKSCYTETEWPSRSNYGLQSKVTRRRKRENWARLSQDAPNAPTSVCSRFLTQRSGRKCRMPQLRWRCNSQIDQENSGEEEEKEEKQCKSGKCEIPLSSDDRD